MASCLSVQTKREHIASLLRHRGQRGAKRTDGDNENMKTEYMVAGPESVWRNITRGRPFPLRSVSSSEVCSYSHS